MKTIKFFAILAIMLGFTMGALAQAPQTDNDVIKAKAEVVAQVNVTKLQDLIFGMVTPGVPKTLLTDGTLGVGTFGSATLITTILGTSTGSEQVGQFSVTKGLNTQVTLGFTLPSTLSDGTNSLAINFTDAGGVKLAKLSAFGGGQADLLFTPGGGLVVANAGATAAYFADDAFYVFIGGTVVPITGQVAGVYQGDITLTATYN